MAKKTEGVLAKETRLKAEGLAAEREAVAKAAAEATEKAVKEAVKEAAVLRRAEKAEQRKRVKKPRFVRGKKEATPKVEASPLPGRSTKAAGKLMSKNVTHRPKKEPQSGPRPKRAKL